MAKLKCSDEDYAVLVRKRDDVMALKSLATNLDFAVKTERWLPDALKEFYIKTSRNAFLEARKIEREIQDFEAKCFVE